MKLKKVRGYIFSRSFMGERVPQHIQNIVISDFCKKNDLNFKRQDEGYQEGTYQKVDADGVEDNQKYVLTPKT